VIAVLFWKCSSEIQEFEEHEWAMASSSSDGMHVGGISFIWRGFHLLASSVDLSLAFFGKLFPHILRVRFLEMHPKNFKKQNKKKETLISDAWLW
jgi:hypothetical protein